MKMIRFTVYIPETYRSDLNIDGLGSPIYVNPDMVEQLSVGFCKDSTVITKQSGKEVEVLGQLAEVLEKLTA